jgi:hypothetical protein
VIARLLARSIPVTWPALLIVDGWPSGGALNGKADDFITGAIAALLIVGLLAAGWLKPLRVVLVAVLFVACILLQGTSIPSCSVREQLC